MTLRTFNILLSFLAFVLSASAQTRIDSSFAFSTNPAKKYSIYLPSSYTAGVANELMVGFHPLNVGVWDAKSWCDTLKAFSESNDLILVCPDGGSNGNVTDQIDYDFTTALLDSMQLWYNIDPSRIYAMGFSVGGVATYQYGLDHANIFSGYIPIGAAVTSASVFSPVIANAEGKPYFLIHGSLDAPAVRFTPMLNALNANCALVNSLLMPGVGHTINFPNRNQLLSDAYHWIDSVNLASNHVNGSFGLTGPATGSTIAVQGYKTKKAHFTWTPSLYAPSCTSYEVLVDNLTGNFSMPLLTLLSNSQGKDTALSLSYHYIDSVLNDFGVPVGGSVSLKWAVAATYYGRFVDTTKSFTLTFSRDLFGFGLLTPSNNATVTLENGKSVPFNWTDLKASATTYTLLFDSLGGDFNTPLVTLQSGGSGSSSSLTLTHTSLYNTFMFGKGKVVNDTVGLIWTVLATDGVHTDSASSVRTLRFIKGPDIGFELISPLDNSFLFRKNGLTFNFNWDSIAQAGVTYTWIFDTLNGDFSNPLSSFPANLAGSAAHFDLNPLLLDSLFHLFSVDFEDTLIGKWTVKASKASTEEFALTPFLIQFFRDFPDGVEEVNEAFHLVVYPNPAKSLLYIESVDLKAYRLYSAAGQLVLQNDVPKAGFNKESIGLDGLPSGYYLLQVATKRGVSNKKVFIAPF
jgi:hypothetical protein